LKFALNLPLNSKYLIRRLRHPQGSDDSLWLATNWGLVRRLPDGREILYSNERPRTDLLTSLLEDQRKEIWVGASTGVYGRHARTLDQLAQFAQLNGAQMDSVAKIESHTGQSVRLPTVSGEMVNTRKLASVTYGKYLYQTPDGHIWIATETDRRVSMGISRTHTTARALLMVSDRS